MSTFYATFSDVRTARAALRELLRGGVSPDSVSLIADETSVDVERVHGSAGILEETRTVGDATAYVGRNDDPRHDVLEEAPEDFTRFSTTRLNSATMGIDTSDIATDIESIDQSEESQEEAEEASYPDDGVSQSEHERDNINLALLTGFPTPIPIREDDLRDPDTNLQEQSEDGFDTLYIPGFGLIAGGGALATAALDFIKPEGDHSTQALLDHLRDEGVTVEKAKQIRSAFENSGAVVAVEIVPGETNEEAVEEITQRHGATNVGLFDAPRYYRNGGQLPRSGGGDS